MGRIKQISLKRVAEKLISDYKEEFNIEFENNKQKVQELSTVKSKTIRNKIAGYITSVMKQEEMRAKTNLTKNS